MAKPRILVTGATGKTGRAVVKLLLSENWPVRALAHRRDARSESLERQGAEVHIASAHDPDQLTEALQGVQRAYYGPIFAPHAVHAAASFAVAAQTSGLEAVVQLSQWLSHPSHPSIMTRETWLIDQIFSRMSGIAHVILNPGMFADNFLRTIDMATIFGVHPVLSGDSQSAPVSNEDIAACAVSILKDPTNHAGRSYRPTGPALMTGSDQAVAIGHAIGRPVRPINLPFWMFLKVARLDNVPAHEALNFRDYLEDHVAGAFSAGGGVTDVVRQLTGRPAEAFETIAARYATSPSARPTLANVSRMVARMIILPFVPQLAIDDYARHHAFPEAPNPRLSAEDTRWRAQHGALSAIGAE